MTPEPDRVTEFKADMHRELDDFKGEIRLSLNRLEKTVTNHLAHRLPTWASVALGLCTAAIGVLAGMLY